MVGQRTLKVVITGDAKDLDRAVKSAGGTIEEFDGKAKRSGGKIADAVAGAFAVGEVINFGGQLLSLGNQLDNIEKKGKTVFEGSEADVRKWAQENAKSFGSTDDQLVGLAANFGDLLKPMGFTAQQAAGMSRDVVGLSGALSAWSGGTKSAAEVSAILAKAMLGERDGLKELGISISEADVQARLAAKGQDKLTGAALEQAKAVATQELIFEKSTDAQKAWADGSFDAIKKQNELKSRVAELREDLAAKLLPAFQAVTAFIIEEVIPAISGIVNWFKEHEGVAIALGIAVGTVLVAAFVSWAIAAAAAAAATLVALAPVIAITAAIAALAAGIIYAYEHWGWFKTAVDTAWQVLQTVFHWIQDHWPLILGILTGPIGLAVVEIVKHWDAIKNGFIGIYDAIVGVAEKIYNAIKEPFDRAFAVVKEIYDHSIGPIVEALSKVKGLGGGFDRKGAYADAVAKMRAQGATDQQIKDILGDNIGPIGSFDTGGIFRAPTPGGVGLAMLRDREEVSTPGRGPTSGARGAGITLIMQGTTFTSISEAEARKQAHAWMDETRRILRAYS